MLIHHLSFDLNKNMKNKRKILTLNRNPLNLFQEWYLQAEKNEINDPNAMDLCTVGKDSKPSSRMVLMKSLSNSNAFQVCFFVLVLNNHLFKFLLYRI